jgi:serine/threonine protein kinase
MRDLFVDAVEMTPERRGVFLDQACAGDADLRAELERLIKADADSSSFQSQSTCENDAPRLPPGKELNGRFRVLRFVAAGGMGDVYEVEDLELHEHIALKTIRPEIVGDAGMLSRFKREIQYAKRVTHPNVCRIYDLGSHREGTGEIVFLTMELLHGETLSSRLRSTGRMALPEALPLVIQMAEALSAAHNAGIIHRDFKPSNVILTGSSASQKAVVTDFGLARSSSRGEDYSITEAGKLIGTPAYMAPEQLTRGQLTTATDVYALGLVIYEMVTGHRPFEGDESAMRRLSQPPVPPSSHVPELDARWETVILCCLDREPARRFQRPQQVVEALTGTSRPTRTLTRLRFRKISRLSLVGVLLFLTLVTAGLFIGRRLWPPSQEPSREALRWYQEGVNAIRDGTYYKASKALEQAVAQAPQYPLAHAYLAEAWMELDYTDKARDEMLRATPPGKSTSLSHLEELRLEAMRRS